MPRQAVHKIHEFLNVSDDGRIDDFCRNMACHQQRSLELYTGFEHNPNHLARNESGHERDACAPTPPTPAPTNCPEVRCGSASSSSIEGGVFGGEKICLRPLTLGGIILGPWLLFGIRSISAAR